MEIIPLNKNLEKLLNDFISKYRERSISYLHTTFSLCREDCEDVVQEASIVLCQAAVDGKLDSLTASMYTYFIGICNNKAHEQMRSNGKIPIVSIDALSVQDGERRYSTILSKADSILNMIDTNEKIEDERDILLQELVSKLPSPCNELLWSYYRDAFSMRVIAKLFNYANEGVAKVTKHRCQEKLRKSYENALKEKNL